MIKIMCQDQIIGPVGTYPQQVLSFGWMETVEYMRDLNILRMKKEIGISPY